MKMSCVFNLGGGRGIANEMIIPKSQEKILSCYISFDGSLSWLLCAEKITRLCTGRTCSFVGSLF